jgi:hypothetical protein
MNAWKVDIMLSSCVVDDVDFFVTSIVVAVAENHGRKTRSTDLIAFKVTCISKEKGRICKKGRKACFFLFLLMSSHSLFSPKNIIKDNL